MEKLFIVLQAGGQAPMTPCPSFIHLKTPAHPAVVALLPSDEIFRYSDPDECTRGLLVAGFESPSVTKIAQTWRLPAGDGLFNAMKDSTVRTAGLLRAQKPTVLKKIREEMHVALSPYIKGDVVELPMPALIASGIKP